MKMSYLFGPCVFRSHWTLKDSHMFFLLFICLNGVRLLTTFLCLQLQINKWDDIRRREKVKTVRKHKCIYVYCSSKVLTLCHFVPINFLSWIFFHLNLFSFASPPTLNHFVLFIGSKRNNFQQNESIKRIKIQMSISL